MQQVLNVQDESISVICPQERSDPCGHKLADGLATEQTNHKDHKVVALVEALGRSKISKSLRRLQSRVSGDALDDG